mmetsp:Transcript_38526/g.36895  ORF Transcript_38526/g.36895 Transcript_38526/m.36895 type:complete len:110 (-) Transcript_38526:96-425(-)
MVDLVSKSPVGSSRRRISGSLAKALEMATLCCSPPDNSEGRWSNLSPSPTLFSNAMAFFFLSLSESFPRRIIGSSTFSNAVIVASRLKVWKTKPMCFNLSSDKKSSFDF